jgi:hypothetical protein
METALLRSCLSLPKISFTLRTCAPNLIHPALAAFDNIMRDSLEDLCGGPISDWSWLKASLPVSLGGLNLRQAPLHAPAAFIGSLALYRTSMSPSGNAPSHTKLTRNLSTFFSPPPLTPVVWPLPNRVLSPMLVIG